MIMIWLQLESKMSELEQMAQQMAAYQYQQQSQGANPTGNASNTATNDDDVVDADLQKKINIKPRLCLGFI